MQPDDIPISDQPPEQAAEQEQEQDEQEEFEFPGLSATYSPEDNKLRVTLGQYLSKPDFKKLKERLYAAGFSWAPKQELFVCPRWTPTAEDLLLELCGDIGDEDYSIEERAADRAERFSGYRDKRRDEAGDHADTFQAGPAAFGHQNLARAERQARRHDRHRAKALNQWGKAEYWQARTAGVIAHALHKTSASVRRGRILTLEAQQRRCDPNGRWYAHISMRLIYENAMLENEGGKLSDADIVPGGFIRPSRRHVKFGNAHTDSSGWAQVLRVFKSPETGRVTSVQVMGDDRYLNDHRVKPRTINVERLGEDCYRAPTEDELKAFEQATKERKAVEKASKPTAPPLVNPTDDDADRLQRIWNERERAKHEKKYPPGKYSGLDFKPSEVLRITQATYSANSKGSYARLETSDVTEKLGCGRRGGGRVSVFKIRTGSAGVSGFYIARRVVVITDKPQKPIPWDLVDAVRSEQPTEDSVRPTLERIRECLSDYTTRSSEEGQRLINDAVYVGWCYSQSSTQSGFTEAGAEAYKQFMLLKELDAGVEKTETEHGTTYHSPLAR